MTSFLLEYQKLQGAVFFLLKWLFRDVGELLDEKLHPRDDHHSIEKTLCRTAYFYRCSALITYFAKFYGFFSTRTILKGVPYSLTSIARSRLKILQILRNFPQ
mmetsp:Transcript_17871/g.35840  ORF Transcript_17871/g.35840 Transcript_17871/m.35840 type:complete len:103 (-) Transcript_17871:1192-1500(-)